VELEHMLFLQGPPVMGPARSDVAVAVMAAAVPEAMGYAISSASKELPLFWRPSSDPTLQSWPSGREPKG